MKTIGARNRLILAAAAALVASACPARAADALTPVELRQVKVGGEIGRRIDVTANNNLLVIDVDKDFLAPFRAKTEKDGYVGLGKLIDTAVRLAAYSGDAKVLARKKHLVEETIRMQQPDGYAGMIAPNHRMRGLWDVHEMGYIVYGLVSDYRSFGDERSLAAARKAADYLLKHWSAIPADWPKTTGVATNVAVTGLERAMLALYAASGDRRYLDFCLRERALPEWDLGIVIGRRLLIEGHIYAYMSRALAQLELYRLQPAERLLAPAGRAVDSLTARDGMAITGGAGQWEIWTDDQDGRGELGETCATAYQLRVYDGLLRLQGDPRYGDLMERTIYNALFGAQSPDGRRIRYYTPFEGKRVYHPTDTYCCPCNYRRIVAELPAFVYYRSASGLAVNLYTPSQVKIDGGDGPTLAVRQETDYPRSGRVVVHVGPSRPAAFPLKLRIPRWCEKATVSVNGRPVDTPVVPGSFLSIEREWKAGDQVVLEMPMKWRLVLGRKRQAGRAAVMRGPLVYCLNPAQDEALAKLDAADLNRLVILPATLEGPVPDEAARPGGTACRLRASNEGYEVGDRGNLRLTLTEFPDPQGKNVYFRLADLSAAVPDELVRRER